MASAEAIPEIIDESAAGNRSSDWPVLAFFALAYLIAWSLFPVLDAIANASGIPNTLELASAAEILQFGDMADRLVVPGWVAYLVTCVQDFAFTIAGIIMTAIVSGCAGLGLLGQCVIKWRVPFCWYLFAFLPWGLYALAQPLPS
jgi:hypothetical protein